MSRMCMGSAMTAPISGSTGDTLNAIDTASGKTVRALDVPAHAGTAFDGRHLYQISGDLIQKVDPTTGRVVTTIPTPDGGASGMAWADGSLWVGQHRKRRIHQVDPQTGTILRTIESNRFVTGVRANSGTAPGNPTKANCAESIRGAARS